MTPHPFRFGVVAAQARTGQAWLDKARRAEFLGYATFVVPDTLVHTLAPLPALAAVAAVTSALRIGTYVIANDYRNPVLLAKEAATLDFLSDGRFELGIGAGRPSAAADHAILGIPFDSGGTRVTRLAESLGIIKPLLTGERIGAAGPHDTPTDAVVSPRSVQQPRPPILVAGSGRRLLTLAAREADIVALGVGPTETAVAMAEKIGWLRAAAGERFADLELNLNIVAVGGQMSRYLTAQFGAGAEAFAQSDAVPVLTGTVDMMCAQLQERRDQFGISYVLITDELMDAFAPIVARLTGH